MPNKLASSWNRRSFIGGSDARIIMGADAEPGSILAERWLDLDEAVRALAELVQMPSAADAYPPLAGQSGAPGGSKFDPSSGKSTNRH